MKQHINFLKSIPKEPVYLPAVWIMNSVLVVLLLLFALSIYLGGNLFYKHQHLLKVQKQRMKAAEDFQRLAKNYPLLTSDKPLVKQVSTYERLLRKEQEKFRELTHTMLRQPFSAYMQALSSAVPHELWLTAIHINEDNNNISLIGYALKPVVVSEFMQALLVSPSFKQIDFDLFDVKKNKRTQYVKFEITNNKLINRDENESHQ